MTLSELQNTFFHTSGHALPGKIYYFDDVMSAISWMEDVYVGRRNISCNLVGVLQSDMKADYTLLPRWRDAQVKRFYAIEADALVAVVTPEVTPFDSV